MDLLNSNIKHRVYSVQNDVLQDSTPLGKPSFWKSHRFVNARDVDSDTFYQHAHLLNYLVNQFLGFEPCLNLTVLFIHQISEKGSYRTSSLKPFAYLISGFA